VGAPPLGVPRTAACSDPTRTCEGRPCLLLAPLTSHGVIGASVDRGRRVAVTQHQGSHPPAGQPGRRPPAAAGRPPSRRVPRRRCHCHIPYQYPTQGDPGPPPGSSDSGLQAAQSRHPPGGRAARPLPLGAALAFTLRGSIRPCPAVGSASGRRRRAGNEEVAACPVAMPAAGELRHCAPRLCLSKLLHFKELISHFQELKISSIFRERWPIVDLEKGMEETALLPPRPGWRLRNISAIALGAVFIFVAGIATVSPVKCGVPFDSRAHL
jgi:hypothetical protein